MDPPTLGHDMNSRALLTRTVYSNFPDIHLVRVAMKPQELDLVGFILAGCDNAGNQPYQGSGKFPAYGLGGLHQQLVVLVSRGFIT